MSSSGASSLVIRRLYRHLLSSAKHFTPPSPAANALTCLLYQEGNVYSWNPFTGEPRNMPPSEALYRQLLRDVVSVPSKGGKSPRFEGDDSPTQYLWPSQVDATRLSEIIRREFRLGVDSFSVSFDEETRREVAFLAIKELNKKAELAIALNQKAKEMPLHPNQAARNVYPLPHDTPSSYLRPGAFLVAHPRLNGFFARSVICILSHEEDYEETGCATYGLMFNKWGKEKKPNFELEDIFDTDVSLKGFNDCTWRLGGPVYPRFQLVYSRAPGENVPIGGTLLPTLASLDNNQDSEQSLALDSDREVYFQGNLRTAAQAITIGTLNPEDVSFYVGASVWQPGQLESEVKRGVWIPCTAPTNILVSNKVEHRLVDTEIDPIWQGDEPKDDVWLSFLCALGESEAAMAHFATVEDESVRHLVEPCDKCIG